MKERIGFILIFVFTIALAGQFCLAQQQPDPARLAPLYRQQRESANDAIAACAVTIADLQARVAELEKRLAEAKKQE